MPKGKNQIERQKYRKKDRRIEKYNYRKIKSQKDRNIERQIIR